MYNRKHPKDKVTKIQMQDLYDRIMDKLDQVPLLPPQTAYDAPKLAQNFKADEPLSFDKLSQEQAVKPHLPTYMGLLNGMNGVIFADEKEEYAQKIMAATHLSQKQIEALLAHLRTKQ